MKKGPKKKTLSRNSSLRKKWGAFASGRSKSRGSSDLSSMFERTDEEEKSEKVAKEVVTSAISGIDGERITSERARVEQLKTRLLKIESILNSSVSTTEWELRKIAEDQQEIERLHGHIQQMHKKMAEISVKVEVEQQRAAMCERTCGAFCEGLSVRLESLRQLVHEVSGGDELSFLLEDAARSNPVTPVSSSPASPVLAPKRTRTSAPMSEQEAETKRQMLAGLETMYADVMGSLEAMTPSCAHWESTQQKASSLAASMEPLRAELRAMTGGDPAEDKQKAPSMSFRKRVKQRRQSVHSMFK